MNGEIDPLDLLLHRHYEEGVVGRAALASTGFVFDHCGDQQACVDNYPFVLHAGVHDGSKLALMLDRRCMALSPWSFSSVDAPDDFAGATYLSDDRLFFSSEADRIAATLMLANA